MKNRTLATTLGIAAAALISVAIPQKSQAAASAATGTGVGIVLGEPSGITLKLPQGHNNSFNLILGYDLNGPDNHLYAGGDYVWYNYNLIKAPTGRMPLYYGPGLYAVVADQSAVGIRGVVGLEYQFAKAPFDIFFELGPRINVIPDTHGDLFGGLGARFFF